MYTVTYLDGSRKTFMPHEFKQFKDGIVSNLYLKNKCSIKELRTLQQDIDSLNTAIYNLKECVKDSFKKVK